MSDKTLSPIQAAIQQLENAIKNINSDYKEALQVVVNKTLKPLLPIERQFAQDAFISGSKRGFVSGSNTALNIDNKTTAQEDFSTYYKKYEL